ncbi:hypothetical protein [Chryseobacterium sp. JAH]|uniref:hypothetical protein n=1 Tax=Chryseobacterium sp. JAH TaxID=1742858 RepID=UPI000740F2D0|nr:hypothetical protein [Chryseobacterium sp. JAH]KUJ50559.1 hypothetical protein AR685_14795 [Chryseobacterium sp. JAH]
MNYSKLSLLVFFAFSCNLFSQTTGSKNASVTLPVVTLMDIEPAGNIVLNFTAPTEAGNTLINPVNNTTKWVNYTSAVAPGGLSRKITASVNQVIPGVQIKIQAAAASGAGGGTMGTSSGLVTLSTSPVTIISGIGGAYTGTGASNGHMLTISVSPTTYANLSAVINSPITITYTITE